MSLADSVIPNASHLPAVRAPVFCPHVDRCSTSNRHMRNKLSQQFGVRLFAGVNLTSREGRRLNYLFYYFREMLSLGDSMLEVATAESLAWRKFTVDELQSHQLAGNSVSFEDIVRVQHLFDLAMRDAQALPRRAKAMSKSALSMSPEELKARARKVAESV